jgi:hypothetical protein
MPLTLLPSAGIKEVGTMLCSSVIPASVVVLGVEVIISVSVDVISSVELSAAADKTTLWSLSHTMPMHPTYLL